MQPESTATRTTPRWLAGLSVTVVCLAVVGLHALATLVWSIQP